MLEHASAQDNAACECLMLLLICRLPDKGRGGDRVRQEMQDVEMEERERSAIRARNERPQKASKVFKQQKKSRLRRNSHLSYSMITRV